MVFNAYFEEWGMAVGGVPRDYVKVRLRAGMHQR